MEVRDRGRPALPIESGFVVDIRFEPVKNGEKFFGGKLLVQQFFQALLESQPQTWFAKKALFEPVPTSRARGLSRAQQDGKLRLIKGPAPIIAKRSIQVPGND